MRIVMISDTHTKHRQLNMPEGDMLIHAGDISHRGEAYHIEDFNNWLGGLDYKYRIVICGNHEVGLDKRPKEDNALALSNSIYLQDSGVEIEGLKIWGSPKTPFFCSWAFSFPEYSPFAEEAAERNWGLIPDDTNILITHGPAYGILDKVGRSVTYEDPHIGCKMLKKRIEQLKSLKLHVFGHEHHSHNLLNLPNYIAVNAASLSDDYRTVREPIIIDL